MYYINGTCTTTVNIISLFEDLFTGLDRIVPTLPTPPTVSSTVENFQDVVTTQLSSTLQFILVSASFKPLVTIPRQFC